MEEEHGEHFDMTLSVLDQIRLGVMDEEGFFWQCFWLSVASSEEQRLGAYNYCFKRMEKFDQTNKGISHHENVLISSRDVIYVSRPGIVYSCFLCWIDGLQYSRSTWFPRIASEERSSKSPRIAKV